MLGIGLTIGLALVLRAQTKDIRAVVLDAQALAVAEPIADKTVPVFTLQPTNPPGTYWSLQLDQPPLPFDPFPS